MRPFGYPFSHVLSDIRCTKYPWLPVLSPAQYRYRMDSVLLKLLQSSVSSLTPAFFFPDHSGSFCFCLLKKLSMQRLIFFCVPASPSTPFSSGKTLPVFIFISIAKAPAFSTHVISMCLQGRSFTYIIVLLTVLLSDNTHFSLRSRQRVCTVRFLRCRFLQTYCSAEQNE